MSVQQSTGHTVVTHYSSFSPQITACTGSRTHSESFYTFTSATRRHGMVPGAECFTGLGFDLSIWGHWGRVKAMLKRGRDNKPSLIRDLKVAVRLIVMQVVHGEGGEKEVLTALLP